MKTPLPLLCLGLCVALASVWLPSSGRADALDNWTATQVVTNSLGMGGRGLYFGGLAYGNGRYVAVGQYSADDNGVVQTSDDGRQWTQRTTLNFAVLDLYDVAFGDGRFVAAGWSGYLYGSTDGTQWAPYPTALANMNRVIYGSGLFVAVGDAQLAGISGGTTNRNIYTSPDGIAWTARLSGSPANDPQLIWDVAYGNGRFVAVDWAHHFYTSTTGTTWTRTTNSLAGTAVSFCKSIFIVASGAGTNLLSTDGLTWTAVTNSTGATFRRVVYGDGCFLATAWTGVYTSPDGTNWLSRPITLPAGGTLWAAVYANQRFMVAGGITPASVCFPLAYISDPVVALTLQPELPPALAVSGLLGRSYQIDSIDDLRLGTWQPATSFTLTNSPQSWTDPLPAPRSRCYRAVLLP